ncbi:MAG: hypothetical protein KGI25_04415 [Thaumarchaeota archaeon]|nr:hypothetical protein [Nitrososphaerota archaeon]
MGIFDNIGDTTGQLKAEGMNVNVTFQPGVPNVGQGTLTWNIPGPVVESVDANGNVTITLEPTGSNVVYGGIVFVLRTDQPCDMTNIPKDGVVYVADPTANEQLFAGDKIGNGLVVGAIYESEQKAQGLPLTTSLIINDIEDGTPYYICGYIHDDQLRYYQEGNRSYSQAIGFPSGRGTPARQVVLLRNIPVGTPTPVKYGVKPTDGTGLVAGATYQFELIYDPNFPKPDYRKMVRMFFSFDGGLTPTYGALVKYLNEQIAIKCTNAVQSPVPPSAGVYYWNVTTKTLYQWDGSQLNVIPNVIVQSNDPANPAVGSYWWNTTNNELYQWTGLQYTLVQPQFAYPTDPTNLQGSGYWWNGVNGFTRCGNTWCETTTYDQTTDPSCPPAAVDCSYWYDTANQTLYNWSGTNWVQAYALMWPQAPNSLSNGTLWYDLNTDKLYSRNSEGPAATVGSINPGHGYVNGTYPNVPLNIGGHGTGALATVVVSNTILTVNLTSGGSQYNNNNDQDFFNVPLIGGSGTGAQATIRVVSGTVIQVLITAGGSGYGPSDTLTVTPASIGGQGITGSPFSCSVATVSGGVQSVTITTQGSNYIIGDVLSTTAPNLGSISGIGFAATVNTLGTPAVNTWIQQTVFNSTVDPTTVSDPVVAGSYWYNPTTEVLQVRDITNTTWNVVPVLVWAGDPTLVTSCELWWNESTSPATLFQWDFVHSTWNPTSAFYQQATDPYQTPILATGTLWWNPNTNTLLLWNGSSWSTIPFFNIPTDPTLPVTGTAWLNTTNNTWYVWGTPASGRWNVASPLTISATDPSVPPQGTFWFNTANSVLSQRVGITWAPIPYVTTPPANMKGDTWYDLSTNMLMEWSGKAWIPAIPCVYAKLEQGQLVFESTARGSSNALLIPIPVGVLNMPSPCLAIGTGQVDYVNDSNSPYQNYPLGGFGNSYNCYCSFETPGSGAVRYPALPINPAGFLFSFLKPVGNIMLPHVGRDGVDGTPTYDQLGVGTNGSPAERRQLMSEVRTLLGYPTLTVELDDTQLDLCVTNALRVFRQKSSLAVDRKAFFLDIQPYKQNYILADKAVGYNKIVNVMAGYRFTAAFLSSAMGAGVYGQIVLQHLYNMGTFDLLSYHLVSQYVENLEILFSTRLVFVFNDTTRELQIFQSFNRPERILLDVTIEKPEQEIFNNRFAHRWIQQYALAEACDMLANIRGKFANLPGAGGSVTLNASDLRAQANDIRTKCQEEIDDYTVQNVEDYGAYGSIAIG